MRSNVDMRETRQAMVEAVVEALRPRLTRGAFLIWKEPYRWRRFLFPGEDAGIVRPEEDGTALIPNSPDSYSAAEVCAASDWCLVFDFGSVAVVCPRTVATFSATPATLDANPVDHPKPLLFHSTEGWKAMKKEESPPPPGLSRREQVWLSAWCARSGSSSCASASSGGAIWADECLSAFDARFPDPSGGDR